jgi:hypothetical protein
MVIDQFNPNRRWIESSDGINSRCGSDYTKKWAEMEKILLASSVEAAWTA